MPCPTCSHTLASLDAGRLYWCERCGTVVVELPDGREDVFVPKLVERARKLQNSILNNYDLKQVRTDMHALGIAESINKPEDRPT